MVPTRPGYSPSFHSGRLRNSPPQPSRKIEVKDVHVRSADRIYVMNEGEIIEHGSHEELIQVDGLYAELFNLQAAAYLDPKTPS